MNYSKASWAVLAAVRFVLALIVFNGHLTWVGIPSTLVVLGPLVIGPAAVLGFLLISGVAIGCSYRERAAGFYTRRFLRIYPLYFAAIAFTQTVVLAVPSMVAFPARSIHAAGLLTTVANLLFLQGIAAIPLPYDGPLWSLGVEAWLYLLTPLFFRMPRHALLVLTAASMFLFSFRGGTFLTHLPALGLLKWCWPWLIGFLVARDQNKILGLLLGILGAVQILLNGEMSAGPANAWLFASVLAFVLGADRAALPGLLIKAANFLGDVSYPLYLFHLPLIILLFARGGVRTEIGFTAPVLLFVVALDFFYEGKFKNVFWKPLTHAIAHRLPPSWSLLYAPRSSP